MTNVEFEKKFPVFSNYQNLILKMMYMNDPYTALHNEECGAIAKSIAEKCNLGNEKIEIIVLAAFLHDVGKQGVPKIILSKPTKLSETEYELVKTHVDIGARLLQSCDFPESIVRIVKEHHERIDGSGYPLGLSGDDLSLGGKIVGIADTISSMQSKRTYRHELTNEQIKEILFQERCKFDVSIFKVAMSVIDEDIISNGSIKYTSPPDNRTFQESEYIP